jgi:opacity protein-like surface antigen
MFNHLSKMFLLLVVIFISPTLFAESVRADTLHIDVPFVELRSGPSAGYPVVHIVEKNENVIVLIKRTSWLKVKDKRGIEGWLHEEDLFGLSQNGEAIAQEENTQQGFQNRDVEGGVMYGDLEGANFYNVYLGYVLTPVFSTEVSLGKALGNISDSNLFEVMLLAQPIPDWIVTPYIGIGGGFIDTQPHSVLADSESRQSTLMSAAAGIKYHIARNFLLRAEYKFSLALTDRDINEEIHTWKIGFSVFF